MYYTVSEVAKQLAISVHTIRYYTDQDLIPNVQRDQNNNRLFDETAINWLIGVRHLKSCGMSLQDIREYNRLCLVGDETIDERYSIIAKQKETASKQLVEAQKRCQYLENKLSLYKKIQTTQTNDVTNPSKWPTIPRKTKSFSQP